MCVIYIIIFLTKDCISGSQKSVVMKCLLENVTLNREVECEKKPALCGVAGRGDSMHKPPKNRQTWGSAVRALWLD